MQEESRCLTCQRIIATNNKYCSRECFLNSGDQILIKEHLDKVKKL